MDKILDLGDVFDLGINNFNPLLLVPVVVAVIAVVAVFVFGFKKTETPPFRKIVGSAHSSSTITKRKKRSPPSPTEASNGASSAMVKAPKLITPVQLAAQKTNKKDAVESKTNIVVAKKTAVPKTTVAAASKSAKAKNAEKNEAKVARALDQVNDGEGEWKTVITKKKKQSDTVAVEKSPTPGSQAKTKNATNAEAKKKDTAAKKGKKQEQTEVVPSVNAVAAEATIEDLIDLQSVPKSESVLPDAPAVNLAFDELEDAAWTETKPQKKMKKRALRE